MALILVLSVFNGLEDLVKSLYAVFYADIAMSAKEGKTFEITDELSSNNFLLSIISMPIHLR
jgi:lipoprotein-releasing system permease protein